MHQDFRMIILSNKASVYDSKIFPIPLINRLEKHFLNSATMLNENQLILCKQLEKWIAKFASLEIAIKLSDIFIGYNDDSMASIILYLIQKNNTGLSVSGNSYDPYDSDFYEEILSKAKNLLLQCSTLDNLYRAINKNLIEKNYLDLNRHHLSLSELLKKTIENNLIDDNKNLLQITTHSKFLLTRKSLASLAQILNLPTKNVSSCLLKSFDTENQFSKKIKKFLSQTDNDKKILIIQCDFSKKFESDLLSCARHSINERLKEAIEQNANIVKNSFIVLLINLSRQCSGKFFGYQVSQWSCHHVDELDESSDYIYDVDMLKSKSLSNILKENLFDIKEFFRSIAHQSCLMIDDTNINRTIERIGLFNNICQNELFFNALLQRLINLQEEKDEMFSSLSESWFNREVINFRRINEHSTMKKSLKSYVESKLSPLLAYLLSKIDIHSNLDTLSKSVPWKCDFFIDIMKNSESLKINYTDMRDELNGKELSRFFCKSDIFQKDFFSNQSFNLNIPFFWLINQQLNSFCQSYLDGIFKQMDENEIYNHFIRTIPSLFENTIFYKIFKNNLNDSIIEEVFDLYLSDFVLVNCRIHNHDQILVIKKAIKQSFDEIDKSDLKKSFPFVHLVYARLKSKIDFFIKFSTLEPKICEHLSKKASFKNLEIESCTHTLKEFNREAENLDNLQIKSEKLKSLINLSRNVLLFAKNQAESSPYTTIFQTINSLRFLDLFHNDVCDQISSFIAPIYANLLLRLKVIIINNSLDFNKLETVKIVHEFLLFCVKKARNRCFLELTVSNCCKSESKIYKKLNTNDCKCFVCSDCENIMKLRMVNFSTVCLACRKKINVKLINNQIGVQLNEIK